ncbi:DUF1501 domain-containing protein [Chitinimonas sp. BJYL2]|uniref:DUF1501 domain-containing protein n=1 Tax=Chitinimonas sp. BJYL2 TaxID=2976696 RepID=UPI0022B3146F|nr:DUF1501 domain-containing protein [Chitinimonas sp. BJYL2]
MQRRQFLQLGSLWSAACLSGSVAWAAAPAGTGGKPRLLIMVELKGGNDGLNTVVPYANPAYYALRPTIAIERDQVLPLDAQTGLHPALLPLMPLWQLGELAVVQGVGYPKPNLSHFRSIEIWDTASSSDTVLQTGWLTRQFAARPLPTGFIADGIAVGSPALGPLDGGARSLVLQSPASFARQAKLAGDMSVGMHNAALTHLYKVEDDIRLAARGLVSGAKLDTPFPAHGFGRTVKTAMEALAANRQIGMFRLTLGSFDTHVNQRATHQRLLTELAEGLGALQQALTELGCWQDTLIMTYAEFGRRPQENRSGGTDHGTASAHFLLGGAVRGGLYGKAPDLANLDSGNLRHSVDFRQLYATACRYCWHSDGEAALGGRYTPLDMLRA